MSTTIAVHSFRRGTGKSHIAANISTLLALEGKRVAVIDANLHSPTIEMLFGLRDEEIVYSLNDYLSGTCEIEQAAHDVTGRLGQLGQQIAGQVYLVPASNENADIARALRHGYDLSLLGNGSKQLARSLQLDVLVVDTGAGVYDEMLNVLSFADTAGVILRLDHQDYQGTDVILRLAHKLEVPRTFLIVNNTPPGFDGEIVKKEVEHTYNCEVAAILPATEELMLLASALSGLPQIFVLRFPEHPLTAELRRVAYKLTDLWNVIRET